MKDKKKNCNCSICNNEIREERQFAALEIIEGKRVIIAAEEFEHIGYYLEEGKTDFEEIIVDDDKECIYVYGVMIPQYKSDLIEKELLEKVDTLKDYAFLTLENHKQYISSYEEIKLFPEFKIYGNIPCVVKIRTDIDFTTPLCFGFGHVFTLKIKDWSSLDCILNRDYCLCLRDIANIKNIDDAKVQQLKKVAMELF